MDDLKKLQELIDNSNNIVFLVVQEFQLKVALEILEGKMDYIQ